MARPSDQKWNVSTAELISCTKEISLLLFMNATLRSWEVSLDTTATGTMTRQESWSILLGKLSILAALWK